MSQTTPLRFAVIGCGLMARAGHLPNLKQSKNAILQTCCDTSDEALDICRKEFAPPKITRNFQEAISDPEVDAIVVATSEKFRLPIFEAAAAARKPVYTEKPLAASWAETLRCQEIVKQSGIPFCVGHNRRASPAYVHALEIFRKHMTSPQPCPWRFNRPGWENIDVKGQDGVPSISIRINDDWRSWKAVHLTGENAEYGLLLAEMTHFVDQARLFLQSEAVRVFTMHNGILNQAVSIEFANQAMASISLFSNGTFGYPKELVEAIGNGGIVVCDHMLEVRTAGIEGEPAVTKFPFLNDRHPQVGREGGLHGWLEKKRAACDEAVAKGDPLAQFTAEPDRGHALILEEFIREIRGERTPVSPVEDAVRVTQICLAAIKSAREKRIVDVAEIK